MTADIARIPRAQPPRDPLAETRDAPKSRRERHREEAATAALGVFALFAEVAQQARELVEEYGDDLPPAVTDGLPRLADAIEPAVQRMTITLKNGRVR